MKIADYFEYSSKFASNAKQREDYIEATNLQRDKAIEAWYQEGGKLFLQWVIKYYRTHSGEPLRWNDPFLREFYLLFGCPWIERVIIQKAAQVGFSEALVSYIPFSTAFLKIPIALGFEEQVKMQEMVAARIQTALDFCPPVQDILLQRKISKLREDIDARKGITIGGVKATFFYAGTRSSKKDIAARQAESRLSSFTAFIILGDEVELWPPGVVDISKQRMAATILPTKPMRIGSTPGHEGGVVDQLVKTSEHIFQWHVNCPCCGERQAVDPFGNFLRPVQTIEDGQVEEKYISPIGQPLKWFHKDPKDPINTAYVGCIYCQEELTKETMKKGHFICLNTQEDLRKFCSRITKEKTVVRTVALILPVIASERFKAVEMIRDLKTSKNPSDTIQQGLGKAFSLGSGKISLPLLISAVGAKERGLHKWSILVKPQIEFLDDFNLRAQTLTEAQLKLPFPTNCPAINVLGVDQGRSANYAIATRWYLPDTTERFDKWRYAYKEVFWHGLIDFGEIDATITKYKINIVGMDNEPEFNFASAFASDHLPKGSSLAGLWERPPKWVCKRKGETYLIDQMMLKGSQFRRVERPMQKMDSKMRPDATTLIYEIDRTFWLDAVKFRLYRGLTSFPGNYSYDAQDNNNLFKHYFSSDRLTDGTWVTSGDEPDHYFHADSIGEAALYASFFEQGVRGGFYIG